MHARNFDSNQTLSKRVISVIHEYATNKIRGNKLDLCLDSAEKLINSKGGFSLPDCRSSVHVIRNIGENRFHEQVAVIVNNEFDQAVNMRNEPTKELPQIKTMIIVIVGNA